MISKQEIEHIAKLSRLGLAEKEIKKLQDEFSSILDYFKLLKQVDTDKVEPTFHPNEELNAMREDKAIPEQEEASDKLISLAPSKQKRQIKVKAVFK